MISVGAIDDDQMLLEATAQWFSGIPDIEIIHTAATVAEYLALDARNDVVLLDLNLRDGTQPKENVARLVRRGDRVLVVSVIPDKEYILTTLEAGAKGYITKTTKNLATLAQTIREVAAGTHTATRELAFAMSRDRRINRPDLSEREATMCRLFGAGLTKPAAAAQMNVTFHTAKSYLERAKAKYEAAGRPFTTRTELQQRLREDDIDPGP
jgi:DNA-binding NarL/FixJ family response regulator